MSDSDENDDLQYGSGEEDFEEYETQNQEDDDAEAASSSQRVRPATPKPLIEMTVPELRKFITAHNIPTKKGKRTRKADIVKSIRVWLDTHEEEEKENEGGKGFIEDDVFVPILKLGLEERKKRDSDEKVGEVLEERIAFPSEMAKRLGVRGSKIKRIIPTGKKDIIAEKKKVADPRIAVRKLQAKPPTTGVKWESQLAQREEDPEHLERRKRHKRHKRHKLEIIERSRQEGETGEEFLERRKREIAEATATKIAQTREISFPFFKEKFSVFEKDEPQAASSTSHDQSFGKNIGGLKSSKYKGPLKPGMRVKFCTGKKIRLTGIIISLQRTGARILFPATNRKEFFLYRSMKNYKVTPTENLPANVKLHLDVRAVGIREKTRGLEIGKTVSFQSKNDCLDGVISGFTEAEILVEKTDDLEEGEIPPIVHREPLRKRSLKVGSEFEYTEFVTEEVMGEVVGLEKRETKSGEKIMKLVKYKGRVYSTPIFDTDFVPIDIEETDIVLTETVKRKVGQSKIRKIVEGRDAKGKKLEIAIAEYEGREYRVPLSGRPGRVGEPIMIREPRRIKFVAKAHYISRGEKDPLTGKRPILLNLKRTTKEGKKILFTRPLVDYIFQIKVKPGEDNYVTVQTEVKRKGVVGEITEATLLIAGDDDKRYKFPMNYKYISVLARPSINARKIEKSITTAEVSEKRVDYTMRRLMIDGLFNVFSSVFGRPVEWDELSKEEKKELEEKGVRDGSKKLVWGIAEKRELAKTKREASISAFERLGGKSLFRKGASLNEEEQNILRTPAPMSWHDYYSDNFKKWMYAQFVGKWRTSEERKKAVGFFHGNALKFLDVFLNPESPITHIKLRYGSDFFTLDGDQMKARLHSTTPSNPLEIVLRIIFDSLPYSKEYSSLRLPAGSRELAVIIAGGVERFFKEHTPGADDLARKSEENWLMVEFKKVLPTEENRAQFENENLGGLVELHKASVEKYNTEILPRKIQIQKKLKIPEQMKEKVQLLFESFSSVPLDMYYSLSEAGFNLLRQIRAFEWDCFILSGESPKMIDYLSRTVQPIIYLSDPLKKYTGFFQAKLLSDEFEVGELIRASLPYYFPELAMNFRSLKKGQFTAATDQINLILRAQIQTVLKDYITQISPGGKVKSSTKETRIEFNWDEVTTPVLKKCGLEIPPDDRDYTLGKLVICYDEKSDVFSCHTYSEIMEFLGSSEDDKIPINPITGKAFPEKFIKKMRERYE